MSVYLFWLKRFLKTNIPLSILLVLVFILPDYLMQLINNQNNVVYEVWMYIALFGFCNLLLLVKKTSIIYTIIAILWITETAHFCYKAYFGGVISASAILQFFIEYKDVFSASLGYSQYLYYAPLIVFLPYALVVIMLAFFSNNRSTVPFVWIILAITISIVPYKIISKPESAIKYSSTISYPSVANSYLNLSTLFFNHIPKLMLPDMYEQNGKHYLPIKVTKLESPGKMTVVVIMTESVTYDHMNLYGYNRDTTPFLSSLKNNPNFIWLHGIAAGISTRVSFNSFWNDVRDPRDEAEFIRKSTNLFHLSANNGFYNQFISAQSPNLFRDLGTEYIQNIYTEKTLPEVAGHHNDNSLLLLAKDVELHDRNFIVFHTRTAHAPYKLNYVHNLETAKYPDNDLKYNDMLVNTYDNAIRYTDHIIEQLVETMTEKVDGPLYFFVTSDHGQLFGDDSSKAFGHGKLVPEVGHVPIIFYSVNGNEKWKNSLNTTDELTHYELTTLMLSMFGYKVDDPNQKDNIYYINGLGYHHGENGYIEVDKSKFPEKPVRYTVYPKS